MATAQTWFHPCRPSFSFLQNRCPVVVAVVLAALQASLIAAEFDPALHAGLIEELKKMYVIVTRAKSNVSCWGWQLMGACKVALVFKRPGPWLL